MARVYEVKYEGKSYWFTGDQCGDKDVAASKVPGCRPGYNCKVSARFTGDVPAEEYIAQQKAAEASAPPTTTESTTWPTGSPSLIEQRATATTSTGTTTTPPATTTPTTSTPTYTPSTTAYKDWSYLATFGTNLERQINNYNSQYDTLFAFDKAGVTSYLDAINAPERTKISILKSFDSFAEAQASYQSYLSYYPTVGAPAPKDFADYLAHFQEWMGTYGPEAIATERQREFEAWSRYASAYGTSDEWYPVDQDDFFANYDKAQEQLKGWKVLAEEKEATYTNEQLQEYYAYRDWARAYGDLGELYAVDIAHYFSDPDTFRQQQVAWEQEHAEVEEYDIDPAEAARRREEAYERGEEAYAESRYAAEERYRETPQYGQVFDPWLEEQAGFSGALAAFTEKEYPSLVSKYKATQPRLTGYPTREEARAEAGRREAGFAGWLGGQMPGVEQEYWGQRPAERGERLWMQQPTMRTVNW